MSATFEPNSRIKKWSLPIRGLANDHSHCPELSKNPISFLRAELQGDEKKS